MTNLYALSDQFGDIDIYLFDQLLRRRIAPGMAVFDAGCGSGRNVHYFLRTGHPVYGIDADPAAIQRVRSLAAKLAPQLPAENFRVDSIESSSFADQIAQLVICSAVLHFARNPDHFDKMLRGAWRLVTAGGILFSRLASSIGVEDRIDPLGAGRFRLPDGTDRYLVTEEALTAAERELGAERIDPLKTTIVQNMRAMTTWVLRKPE